MSKARSCGSCNACCVSLEIRELDKPSHQGCKHLKTDGKGCSIYSSRPSVCRVFKCAWLDGKIDSGMRPDRCGIIVWGAPKELDPEGELVVIQECKRGALSSASNMGLLRQLMKKVPVAVVPHHGRQDFFGPPEKIARVRRLHVLPDEIPCEVTVHEGTSDEVLARDSASP